MPHSSFSSVSGQTVRSLKPEDSISVRSENGRSEYKYWSDKYNANDEVPLAGPSNSRSSRGYGFGSSGAARDTAYADPDAPSRRRAPSPPQQQYQSPADDNWRSSRRDSRYYPPTTPRNRGYDDYRGGRDRSRPPTSYRDPQPARRSSSRQASDRQAGGSYDVTQVGGTTVTRNLTTGQTTIDLRGRSAAISWGGDVLWTDDGYRRSRSRGR